MATILPCALLYPGSSWIRNMNILSNSNIPDPTTRIQLARHCGHKARVRPQTISILLSSSPVNTLTTIFQGEIRQCLAGTFHTYIPSAVKADVPPSTAPPVPQKLGQTNSWRTQGGVENTRNTWTTKQLADLRRG